jgi:hypothetical protein
LRNSETSIKTLQKAFKQQSKINKRFAVLALLGGVYIATAVAHIQKQNEQIEEIKMELEELKKTKGE